MVSFYDLFYLIEGDGGLDMHGTGGKTTRRFAGLPPSHPDSLYDIGKDIFDKKETPAIEANPPRHNEPSQTIDPLAKVSQKSSEGSEVARNILGYISKKYLDDFPQGAAIDLDEFINRLIRHEPFSDKEGTRYSLRNVTPEQIKNALPHLQKLGEIYLRKGVGGKTQVVMAEFKPSSSAAKGLSPDVKSRVLDPREAEKAVPGIRYPSGSKSGMAGTGTGSSTSMYKDLLDAIDGAIDDYSNEYDRASESGFGFKLNEPYKKAMALYKKVEASHLPQDVKNKYKSDLFHMKSLFNDFMDQFGGDAVDTKDPTREGSNDWYEVYLKLEKLLGQGDADEDTLQKYWDIYEEEYSKLVL